MEASEEVAAAIVDLCAQVNAQFGALKKSWQTDMYEVCRGLNDHLTLEMNRLVKQVWRLVDQNAVLCDRVLDLETLHDTAKVLRRARRLHNQEEGQDIVHVGGSESVASVRRGRAGRRMPSYYRQAG